jgi:IS30 family transposase
LSINKKHPDVGLEKVKKTLIENYYKIQNDTKQEKPKTPAEIERFNGSLRRELLNAFIFKTIDEVRDKTQNWMMDYNQNRPHKALNYKTPFELMKQIC